MWISGKKTFMRRTHTFWECKTFSKITGTQRTSNCVHMMYSREHLIVNQFEYHIWGVLKILVQKLFRNLTLRIKAFSLFPNLFLRKMIFAYIFNTLFEHCKWTSSPRPAEVGSSNSIYIEKKSNHSVDNDFTPKFSKFWNYGVYLTIQYAAWPGRDIFFEVNIVDHST